MTGNFTFLHAADLHIDSPLRGLSNYEGAPADSLRLATREAFLQLVDAAIERKVTFLILAGDLFDGDWNDFDSGLWFVARMRQLDEAGIEVFAIRGNHDAASKMTRKLRQPGNVHFFDEEDAESIRRDDLGLVLHGQSYADAATEDNLASEYPHAVEGAFNIGILHTALEGREGHDRYAPCTIDDLRAKGYDYWALGHVHTREVVSEDPWIVFPGNIQGRHIREAGAKGATLVSVEDGAVERVEALEFDVWRWKHLVVDAMDAKDETQLLSHLNEALNAALAEADGRPLAVRVEFSGATHLDSLLRLDEARIRAEVRSLGMQFSPDIWIEKVRISTQPAGDEAQVDATWSELASSLSTAQLSEDEFAQLAGRFSKLTDRLPPAVRDIIHPSDRAHLAGAFEPARRYLSALLHDVDSAQEDDA